ncbi:MAG: hypothetical protein E4G99_11750 [Anaerolineales bacterium]|nr:MAG: hypothetical protein E4G99_11750 [Anaerolineales bacterium]
MGFDMTTLLLLLILGPTIFILGWRRPFAVLSGLVLLLPFRDLSIRALNAFTSIPLETVNSLSRWWMVIVLALLGVWAVKGIRSIKARRRLPKPGILDILLGILLILGLIEALLSPNQLAGITSLRGYLQPLLVFLLARSFIPKSTKELRFLNIALLVVGGLLFAMALWQFVGWTEETYKQWGYVDQIGRITGLFRDLEELDLGTGFIRPASTVSGPNELGSLMLILFFLALQWLFLGPRNARPYLILLSVGFVAGLAMTNSRSVFIGFIASAGMLILYLIRNFRSSFRGFGRSKWILIAVFSFIGLAGFLVMMDLMGMLDIVIWSIQHPLADAHIVESLQAVGDIWRQPAGVGMGMVWPKGAAILQETKALYHIEGSLFQIAFEWGVGGFAVWMLFIGISLKKTWKGWERSNAFHVQALSGMAVLGWVGILMVLIFLPLMQSVNLMVLLWFILGLGVGLESSAGNFPELSEQSEAPS